jgi:transposase
MEQDSASTTNTQVYVGIDVHLKTWKIAIETEAAPYKRFTHPPSPEMLIRYLHSHFPSARYHCVYEAGFSGFWIQEALQANGVNCIVVHPPDIPTTNKERLHKSDDVDASKLARALRNGELNALYVPSRQALEDRTLVRLRGHIVRKQTRVKNQIKAVLRFYGIAIPAPFQERYWSRPFLNWLRTLSEGRERGLVFPSGQMALKMHLDELDHHRRALLESTRAIRKLAKEAHYTLPVTALVSLPGISTISAMIWLTELVDINRFRHMDQLASYVGMVPTLHRSGEHERPSSITRRRNATLRHMLIESAWIATRNDPNLLITFNTLCKRMPKNEAIIRIARKLLARIRWVLRNGHYEMGTSKRELRSGDAARGNQNAKIST